MDWDQGEVDPVRPLSSDTGRGVIPRIGHLLRAVGLVGVAQVNRVIQVQVDAIGKIMRVLEEHILLLVLAVQGDGKYKN